MHVAARLFEAVVVSSEAILKETYGYSEAGLSRDWQIVRLAALLHDVGHAPFSHATEHLLPMKAAENYVLFPGQIKPVEQFKHEDYSVAIIETLFAELIEQDPGNRRNAKITATDVTALIAKRAPGGASLFWKDIISGQLDADRMDYLLRDSLHAGVSYGKYDLDRIVASVCAVRRPKEESDEPKIAIMKGGAYAAEALIVARYWMHKQVYFHKTRLACNYHLEHAVRDILKETCSEGCYPRPDTKEQLVDFLKWDDYRVMGLLTAAKGGEHGRRLMERDHYRLICELGESDASAQELRDSAARNSEIIANLGSIVKLATQPRTLWYKSKADDLILVDDETKEQVGFLSEYSSLMRSINNGSLQFVYADKKDVKFGRELYQSILRRASPESGGERHDEEPPSTGQMDLVVTDSAAKPVQRDSTAQKGIQNAS